MATTPSLHRREFMMLCGVAGVGGTVLPAALWGRLEAPAAGTPPGGSVGPQAPAVTRDMLIGAEGVIGVAFTDAERDLMLNSLNSALQSYTSLHGVTLDNGVVPAVLFNPVIPGVQPPRQAPARRPRAAPTVPMPSSEADLAFLPVAHLAALVRARKVSSAELTQAYLRRLQRFDDTLKCVITLTEERALQQARTADQEIARGRYRGPLHGIPWGAKDLLAVPGYPTTWGSPIYREQRLTEPATVVERLDAAGAVLVAKLSLGELAQGDVWYGGMTRNPWKTDQGSSGSSAGAASATVAGLVGFSIGSETLGSIVSPSTRCGATGLRPTFGRVSRHGAMALSWTMDKLGPICRGVEDCALVLEAIAGPDGKDLTVHDRPFSWDASRDVKTLTVGYLKEAFDRDRPGKEFDDATVDTLRRIGFDLQPITIPGDLPLGALRIILNAEAGAAFQELVLSGKDDQMVQQTRNAWPNSFRSAQLIPAVEYIQANRVRTMVMQQLETVMRGVDCFVTPSFGGNVLLLTNLTGHPTVVLPNGYREDGTPVSVSFVGRLFGEAETLAAALRYQEATDFHTKHPPGFTG